MIYVNVIDAIRWVITFICMQKYVTNCFDQWTRHTLKPFKQSFSRWWKYYLNNSFPYQMLTRLSQVFADPGVLTWLIDSSWIFTGGAAVSVGGFRWRFQQFIHPCRFRRITWVTGRPQCEVLDQASRWVLHPLLAWLEAVTIVSLEISANS